MSYFVQEGANACSPINPCELGGSCITLEGKAYCQCPGEDEYFELGKKSCSSLSSVESVYDPATANGFGTTTASIPFMDSNWTGEVLEDACFPENPCDDGVVCVPYGDDPLCECSNGGFVEIGVSCPSDSNGCNTTICEYDLEVSKCVTFHGAIYCDCANDGIFTLPCQDTFSLSAIHYIGFALVGLVVFWGLMLCQGGSSKGKDNDYEGLTASSAPDSDELSTDSPNLKMKQEYQELVKSDRTFLATTRARLLVIIGVALWGTELGMIQRITDFMPLGITLVLRFTFPVVITIFCFATKNNEGWGPFFRGLESGIWFGIGVVAQTLALQSLSDSVVDFIIGGTGAIFVLILDVLICRDVWFRQWFAAVVATGGTALLTLYGKMYYLVTPTPLDLVYAFIVPIGYTTALWRMAHALEKYPEQYVRLTAAQMQSTLFVCIIYFFISEEMSSLKKFPWGDWVSNGELWFYIIWTGIVSTLIPNLFINFAMATLTSAETALLYTNEQIFAALYSFIFFGTRFMWDFFVGAGLIILSCLVVMTVPSNRPPPRL